MFDLTLLARETGSKIHYENSSFICTHRKEINQLAQHEGAHIMHNNVILFETEKNMYSFASKIATIK